MKLRYIFIVVGVILTAVFLAGCTDKTKDNPTKPEAVRDGIAFQWPMQFESIFMATIYDASAQNPSIRGTYIYTPPGYNWREKRGRPYPVLYLLSPFQSNDLYFYEHGLKQIADRLIGEGKIEPMIIVTFDGQSLLGGSFFTNSTRQGGYFSALFQDIVYRDIPVVDISDTTFLENNTVYSNSLITRIDREFLTIPEASARAIGGVGMGGYGAFLGAVRTDFFGSVSALNAPLDFDGSGEGGFLSIIDDILPIDSTNWPIDTSLADPSTSLIVSASSAFSAHIDSLTYFYYNNDISDARTSGYETVDSITDDMRSYLPIHQSHSPVDSLGIRNDFIWGLWMENNIDDIYTANADGFADKFAAMPKLLISSDDAKFHYKEQMDAFTAFLAGSGITYQHQEFEGTPGMSGIAEHFLYDLLEDILIFHSENFQLPDGL